jgi:hypothetical protein
MTDGTFTTPDASTQSKMTDATLSFSITLAHDHYTLGDEKREYDIRITSSPLKIAQMDAYGIMCVVSFVGEWNVRNDEDWGRAVRREIYLRVPNATDEQEKEQLGILGKEVYWFHTFSNGNWDEAEKIINADAEIRSRFNAFATRWWKVVCELILHKVLTGTYDDWIAGKREAVGLFLENGVEKDEINEQKYNASYKNYKQAYELLQIVKSYCDKMVKCWKQEVNERCEDGRIEEIKKDWAINHFSAIRKSSVIYDRENWFHLIVIVNLNTIVVEKLKNELLQGK